MTNIKLSTNLGNPNRLERYLETLFNLCEF
jgi:hypothetical protein